MKKKYIFIPALTIPLILFTIFLSFKISGAASHTDPSDIIGTKDAFKTVDSYISHLQKSVNFKEIKLNIITVEKGDNFWKIARKYGVDIDTLIAANPFWEDLLARIDQRVVVPDTKGVLAFVDSFDGIETLRNQYNAEKSDILLPEFPAFYRISRFFKSDPEPIAVFIKDTRPITTAMTDSLAAEYSLREKFRSPLGGRYSSFFGKRTHPIYRSRGFHNGIDIAAPTGTLIGAAREGVVTSTGWMGGYGLAVIVEHPEGYRTLYGHMSKVLTAQGRKVRAGSIIGRVGSTGLSTGPHLHFTLWHNGRLINPMKILW